MEQLDLTRHNPDQFEGKGLSVGGRDYVVGALFRDSSQGRSHALVNRVSGLALHVVQIRREYRDAPASARGASRLKVEMTATLRTDMLAEKGETPICALRAFDAASGSLEMHEFPWHPATQGDDAMRRAGEHMEANRLDSAKAELAALLAANPHHTHALAALAEYHARAGNPHAALGPIARAVEIEPNFTGYRVQQMRLQLHARMPALAIIAFDEFRQVFPGEHDCDLPGIQAHALCGQPQQASALFGKAALPAAQRAELAPMLAEQCRALDELAPRMRTLSARVLKGSGFPDGLLDTLELERSKYANSPFLNANLAFALRRAGRLKEAIALLMEAAGAMPVRWMPHCWINAGLCAVQIGDLMGANWMIGMGMRTMGYPHQKLDPVDMPDLLNWMDETHGITMESRQHTGADVLIDWLADPRPAVAPAEEVKALAQLYEKTSVTYTRNSSAPPAPFAAAGMREAEKLLGPGSTLLGQRPSWWQRLMRR